MTVYQKFVADMALAGIGTEQYNGRFFWTGPAARSNQQHGPTLREIIGKTAVPLQWDNVDANYVVYPVGMAKAEWQGAAADWEIDEPDAYGDGYAARTTKDSDEEDED